MPGWFPAIPPHSQCEWVRASMPGVGSPGTLTYRTLFAPPVNESSQYTIMDRDAHLVRDVISKTQNPRTDADRELRDAAREHGDDAIREFVRVTVMGEMTYREAGEYVFDDRDIGQDLGVVVSMVIYRVE